MRRGRVHRVFEYDDYPRKWREFVIWLRHWIDKYPHFRANVFAIPVEMRERHWRALYPFGDRVRVYPHGWRHKKYEARRSYFLEPGGELDQLINLVNRDRRWGRVFKGAHYGCSVDTAERLGSEWIGLALKSFHQWPFPAPEHVKVFCRWDLNIAQDWAPGRSVLLHPDDLHKGMRLFEFTHTWRRRDRFLFIEDLLEPAQRKVHLGCGPHVWRGWRNFDNRADELENGSEYWEFPAPIPLMDCTAEVVAQGHLLNYLDPADWTTLFLDVWRVLRPGGVYRLSEDTSQGYVWRQIGQQHATGLIKANPTQESVITALESVGFTVRLVEPDETSSPHQDVLQLTSRKMRYRRGHKFYCEAIKQIEIDDLARPWREDERALKAGPYVMPGLSREERSVIYLERIIGARRAIRKLARRITRRSGPLENPLAASRGADS